MDVERLETRRTTSDVGMLQHQISEMSRDLQDWKSDVVESRRQFHDQQTRDLAALEELNLTVEMLIEQARLIVSPNAVTRDDATNGWTGTDQNAAPSLESNQ